MSFSVSASTIDVAAARKALADPHCGAFVAFEGWVRNHNEGQAVERAHGFGGIGGESGFECRDPAGEVVEPAALRLRERGQHGVAGDDMAFQSGGARQFVRRESLLELRLSGQGQGDAAGRTARGLREIVDRLSARGQADVVQCANATQHAQQRLFRT